MADIFDLMIIGGGPAGYTAALYGARAGLTVGLMEKLAPGGQMGTTDMVDNYPGFPEGINGFELAMKMKAGAERFGARTISAEVTGLELSGDIKTLQTPKEVYKARTVILATGAQPRELGLPRERELRGKGVSYCATCDGNFFRGRDVAVIGGGNTAVADVIYLARICRKVYLVHRRDKLRATAIYHQRLAELDNVEMCWDSVAEEFLTEDEERPRVSGLRIRNVKTDEVRDLPVSAVFVAVGMRPNTEFLGGALALDAGGYIIADGTGRTATADVFAAGDVRTKELRQVVTAVADGANCAESAADFLDA